jgi:hypothetical protein
MASIKDPLPSHRAIQEEAHALINRLRPQIRSYFSRAAVTQNPQILEAFVTSLGKLHGLLDFLNVECERLEDKAGIEFDEELNVLVTLYDAFRYELDRMQALLVTRGYELHASREFANQMRRCFEERSRKAN